MLTRSGSLRFWFCSGTEAQMEDKDSLGPEWYELGGFVEGEISGEGSPDRGLDKARDIGDTAARGTEWTSSRCSFKGISKGLVPNVSGNIPEADGGWGCMGWGILDPRGRELMATLVPGLEVLAPTWFRWYSMGDVSAEEHKNGLK